MGDSDPLAALLADVMLHSLAPSSSDLTKFIVTVTEPIRFFLCRSWTFMRMREYELRVFLEEVPPEFLNLILRAGHEPDFYFAHCHSSRVSQALPSEIMQWLYRSSESCLGTLTLSSKEVIACVP